MNENQKAAVDALIADAKDVNESDFLLGCVWKGLETMKKTAREQLARAVLAGEVGSVTSYRVQIIKLEEFDKAMESHPYAVRRQEELKAEQRKQQGDRMAEVIKRIFDLKG